MVDLCSLGMQRIKNIIAFPFIHDGIPILYYGMLILLAGLDQQPLKAFIGQEQGYTGGNDPFNREA
jgi:alpha-amylase